MADERAAVSLSADGTARRRAIRDRIVARLVQRRRRRRAAEALIAVACALLLTMLLQIAQRDGGARGPRAAAPAAPPSEGPFRAAPLVQVRRLGDDPSVLARCRLAPGERVRRLDDDALWSALGAAGRGGGLVKVDGGGVLLAGIVTDSWTTRRDPSGDPSTK
jgi:hypothetical protein